MITCPGIFPLILTFLWRRQSRIAVIASAYLGLVSGLAVWIGTAHRFYGEVTVATTGQTLPCMYGTVVSAFSPLLYSGLISLSISSDFDWKILANKSLEVMPENGSQEQTQDVAKSEEVLELTQRRWARYALLWATATFLGHWVLWPLPMYAARFIFSRGVSQHEKTTYLRIKSLLIVKSFSSHGSLWQLFGYGLHY